MEEENPQHEAQEAQQSSYPMDIETKQPSSSQTPRLLIVGVVLIVSLLIAGLFLPPISLGKRLGGNAGDANSGTVVNVPEGAILTEEASVETANGTDIAVHALPASALESEAGADSALEAMAANLPATAQLEGNVYFFDYSGAAPEGVIHVSVPSADKAAVLDLYSWDGSAWAFMPAAQTEGRFVSDAVQLPVAVAVMETAAPDSVAVGAEVLPTQQLPAAVLPQLTDVVVGTLTLDETGSLSGETADVTAGGYKQLVRATNTGVIVDQASLAAMLEDENLRAAHAEALIAAAESYAGLNLDYQSVPASLRDTYSAFVGDLASALEANGKTLAVTLGTPTLTDSGQWESGGQDWQVLGNAADVVYVQMPINPSTYAEGDVAEQLVAWSVSQIRRDKVALLVSANAVDAVGTVYRELPNNLALANFGELSLVTGDEAVEPGTVVEVGLAGTASPLEWDADSMMYRYTYEQAGQEHTVWLNNEAALSNHLRFAEPYRVHGVVVRGLGDVSEGEGYAQALESYVNAATPPEPTGAAIVWTVEDEEESVVASSSGEALSYRWEDTEVPGRYQINANFAQGDAVAKLGSMAIEIEQPPAPTPEPTEAPVAEAEAGSGSGTAATPAPAAPAATPTPAADIDPGSADAVVNFAANFRNGPGLAYGIIEVLNTGTRVSLIGRNSGADWYQVQLVDAPDKEGWIFGTLLTINSSVNASGLPVVQVDPPAGGTSGGGAPAPPPIANTGFELGGQAFGSPYGQMQYAGMTWVKRQHKWSPGNTGQEVAGMITEAHNAGMKILLSIPGADHSNIDYNAYVQFLGRVAALPDPPDAIEVWNEQNIEREWPAGQISPQTYVQNMLIPASRAIKAANPNIMVISGAPAPTGFFGGSCGAGGCDDNVYVAGMAAAGAASYIDCVGVHYNEGILPPSQQSGDPRASSDHYTRYFWGMVNAYYNAFGGSRPLCFTELGYLTGEGYGALPGGFAWAGNVTVAQQAQWLAEAASLSASSGKVRMMIVWNVDSTTWNSDPQAGFAIIRPGGGCPACETLHQVMGR